MIGLAEQDVNLDRFLDVEETLLYHGGYYGMDARRRAAQGRRDDGRLRPAREGPRPRADAQRRHAPAPAARPRAHARAAARDPRRADRGRRLRAAPRAVGVHPPPAQPRHDDPPHDALPRGGRGAVRGDRADPRRPAARARHGARACASSSRPTRSPTSTSRRWRRDRRPRRAPPRPARARLARGAPRAEAVDADRRRADPLVAALHPGLRAVARLAHPPHRRRPVRHVHRPRAHHDGDDPGDLREQLGVGLPGALRPLPQRRPRRADAQLGDQPRAVDRRRRARDAHRRRAAALRPADRRRADPRAGRPPARAGARRSRCSRPSA